MIRKSKKDYEEYLNELGVPKMDQKSNGGRIPDNVKYGSWLRRNDQVTFNVGYMEWYREN